VKFPVFPVSFYSRLAFCPKRGVSELLKRFRFSAPVPRAASRFAPASPRFAPASPSPAPRVFSAPPRDFPRPRRDSRQPRRFPRRACFSRRLALAPTSRASRCCVPRPRPDTLPCVFPVLLSPQQKITLLSPPHTFPIFFACFSRFLFPCPDPLSPD